MSAPDPDRFLIPVPLHSSRERERGYNQSALIARTLVRAGFGRLAEKDLKRTRATPSQTALDREARRENVVGAFVSRPTVNGARIWLVDDVVTTGATVNACADALMAAGAASVDVVALASPHDASIAIGSGPSGVSCQP